MTHIARCVTWKGTPQELWELNLAVKHHCTCQTDSTCPSHGMLWEDQRAADGLLFARRILPRLLVEELGTVGHSSVR